MSSTRRFLFETSFDEGWRRHEPEPPPPPPEPEPDPEPAPPPEPTFSRAELLQAHEDGYNDGFAAGRQAAEQAAASLLAARLGTIERQLADLLAQAEAQARARRDDAARIALAIARKLLPAAARRHALGEIEALVTSCVADMIDEPRLVVRVAEEDLDAVAERIDAMTTARGYAGKLILLAEPRFGPGDCRIEWAEGGVERDSESLWREIERIASRHLDMDGETAPHAAGA